MEATIHRLMDKPLHNLKFAVAVLSVLWFLASCGVAYLIHENMSLSNKIISGKVNSKQESCEYEDLINGVAAKIYPSKDQYLIAPLIVIADKCHRALLQDEKEANRH